MKQYLLSIYQPDGPPPADLDLTAHHAGRPCPPRRHEARWRVGLLRGLAPASTATVVRVNDGESLITDGPFTEGKEHLGGFTIIKAADLDVALEWGRKLARMLTPLSIEVRPIQDDSTH